MAFRNNLSEYSKTFSPPLAMQESVWSSILNGDFIDAKIFAFSRRSHTPGRVDTPKPLFVNTHVLATACSYFESSGCTSPSLQSSGNTLTTAFSFSDGIETDINSGLPSNIEPFLDIEEGGLDSDFDDPVEDEPTRPQPHVSPTIPKLPQGTVKTYVVKYTAYQTLVGNPPKLDLAINRHDVACARLSGIFTREKSLSSTTPLRYSAPPQSPFISLQMRFVSKNDEFQFYPLKLSIAQYGTAQNASSPVDQVLHQSAFTI